MADTHNRLAELEDRVRQLEETINQLRGRLEKLEKPPTPLRPDLGKRTLPSSGNTTLADQFKNGDKLY